MYISARERQILENLLLEKELTVKELADRIGVSSRTVHRDLKNVEDILHEYELKLQKKSGVGVQIEGDPQKIQELQLFLYNLYHTEYTPDERQTMILCELLEANGPVKLLGLANDLNVTIATVSTDLTKLEEKVHPFGLTLIRKRGYGVELEGDESDKRRVMRNLISEHVDDSEILSLARETIQKRTTTQINTISEKLLGLVEKQKLQVVEKVVESAVQGLPFSIADSAFIGLVIHLALAVERIQKGEAIRINQSYLDEQQSQKEFKYAKKIASQLEKVFHIAIPEAEIAYITMHLKGAKLRYDHEYMMEDSSMQVAIKTKALIDHVGKRTCVDLSENRSLFEGLVLHLKPAIYRIKQRMGISNPLLPKIRQDYAELFSIVKQAVEEVFFYEYPIPDEEIGYLVMHFGAAIIGRKEATDLRAVVICSSGIGTSKMLVTKLQKEFPELEDIQNISVMDFKNRKRSANELVISTIPIPDPPIDYILVTPILTKDDTEKIRMLIEEQKRVRPANSKKAVRLPIETLGENPKRIIKELRSIQEYSQAIADLIDGFEVVTITGAQTPKEILTIAGQRLMKNGCITDVNAIVSAMLDREKLGGLGIPDTTMALYHARSPATNNPAFIICQADHPVMVAGMDGQDIEVMRFLFMISPVEVSETVLELLSYLSSLVIENEESISLFQSGNEEALLAFLASRYDQFFTDKIHFIRSGKHD